LSIAWAIALLCGACGLPDSATGDRPMVTLYLRNASPVMAWFAIEPTSNDTPQTVGLGGATQGGLDGGAACLDAEIGAHVVQLDRSIPEGGSVIAVIGSVDQQDTVLSVDVGAGGDTVIGHGIPAWWREGPTECRPAEPDA
jgi:hypothetical protein